MRSVFAARALAVLVLVCVVFSSSLGSSGLSAVAQDGSPASDQQTDEGQPAGQPVEEALPTETPTTVPELPAGASTPPVEPTIPSGAPATEVPVQAAADEITLMADPSVCSSGLGFWQVFVTMDGSQFPATATLNYSNGDSASVAYQQSSFIGGRYYGYFEWSGNTADQLVSITGAFPADLDPRIEYFSGPNCGPPTATATATATPTATATATATATLTPTVSTVTLPLGSAPCYTGLGFWQVFVTMDGWQFPSSATLNFESGESAAVLYQQSSYIGGRYYGFFESSENLDDEVVSISGAFPAELNPRVETVSGPNCGPPTVTPSPTLTSTASATATASPSATPGAGDTTLLASSGTCYSPFGFWRVFVLLDAQQFPATATLTFGSGVTATAAYTPSSYLNGRYYGYYDWNANLGDELVSISGAFPAQLNPSLGDMYGPRCGPAAATATPTATDTNTPTQTSTPAATDTRTPTNTQTPSSTPSNTATPTETVTNTPTKTATSTSTPLPTIVTSANVNCRIGPSTSETSLGVVPNGTRLTLRGAVQNGWTPVVCFDQNGWISASYAPTTTPTLIPIQGVAFMQSTTNCFMQPSLSSRVIGSVNANARLPLRGGLQNGWYPVVCLGQNGWVLGSYVAVQTVTPTRTATSTSTPMPLIVTSANVNCRTSPNTTATILGVVPRGTSLGVRGAVQNGWTPVVCFDQNGWISASYTPTATPTLTATRTPTLTPSRTPTRTATATPTFIPVTGSAFLQANTNCFAQPNQSSAVVGTINRNAVIPLLGGLQNGWYPVICNGQTSWILGGYIKVVTPTATATATATLASSGTVTTTARVNCRSAANTSASIVAVVNSGVVLPVRGATVNDWTPVTCGGQNGWIASRYLR